MASCPTPRREGRFSLLVMLFSLSRVQGRSRHTHHATSLPADTVSSETPRSVSVVCVCASPMHTCPCRRPWTVPRRPGSRLQGSHSHTASHAAAFFPRSGSAMFCASMAHTAEPDCGSIFLSSSSKSGAPQPARQAAAGAMASQIRPLSEPAAEPMSKVRWHRLRPAGPPKASFIARPWLRLPLASAGLGPSASCTMSRAGRPYRPCFRRSAVQRGRG